MGTSVEQIAGFRTTFDIYNGITIQHKDLPNTKEEFEKNLDLLIQQTKNHRFLIWIYISKDKSSFIDSTVKRGFEFHTCSFDTILVVKRLKKDAIIPTAANHTLGVGMVVINDKKQLLVIKERNSYLGYKTPGGHIDDKEMISSAAVREVYEETGIKVSFESIVSIGHFYPHQFDKSNLFLVCKAKPLSQKIDIQDTDEIEDAKWVDLEEFLSDDEVKPYSKDIVNAALGKMGNNSFKKVQNHSLKDIPKDIELFF